MSTNGNVDISYPQQPQQYDHEQELQEPQQTSEEYYEDYNNSSNITEITENTGDTNSNISDYPDDNESHRSKLIKEIHSTEKSFNQHLNNAITFYLEPLRNSQPAILENHMLVSIFSNIEEIRDISSGILNDLERILYSEQSESVCSPFLSRKNQFQSFISYGKNQGNSIETIQKLLEKKPSFTTFLASVRDLNGHQAKLDLNAFLITPIQRLPRYKLLFTELIKNTENSHPDYHQIEEVLEFVTKTTQCVNEEIRKQENKAKVELIQNSLVGGPRIISEGRLFVREGFLMKVCRKSPKPRWFFLFTDSLMYTSFNPNAVSNDGVPSSFSPPNGVTHSTYTFHRFLLLTEINKIKDIKDRDNQKNAFQIVSSSQKSFTVYAGTPKEKNNWLKDFKELLEQKKIEENSSGGYEHTLGTEEVPVWVPDREASKCMFCNDSFTIINRRHHCRNCGKVVCGSCSNGKKLIPNVKKNKPVRVCLFCFDYITINEKESNGINISSGSGSSNNLGSLSGSGGGGGSTIEVSTSKYNTISRLNSILERKRSNSFLPLSPEQGQPLNGSNGVTKESSHGTLKKKLFGSSKDKDKRENSLPSSMISSDQSNTNASKDYNRTQSEPYLITKTNKGGVPILLTLQPGFTLPLPTSTNSNSPGKSGKETLKFQSPEFIKPKLQGTNSTFSLTKPPVPNTPLPPIPNSNSSGDITPPPSTINMITPTHPVGSSSSAILPPINPNTVILRRTLRSNSQPVPPPLSSLPISKQLPPKMDSSKSLITPNKPPTPTPTPTPIVLPTINNGNNGNLPSPTHSPSSDNISLPSLPKILPPKPPQRSPSSSSLNHNLQTPLNSNNSNEVVTSGNNNPITVTNNIQLPKLITRTQTQSLSQNNINNNVQNSNPNTRPRSNSNSTQPITNPDVPFVGESQSPLVQQTTPTISFTTVKRNLPTPPTNSSSNNINGGSSASLIHPNSKRPLPTPPITQ